MENLNLQCCRPVPNPCNFENAEPKPIVKPEVKLPELTADLSNKPVQKPWSVFKDVYWI